MADEQAAPATGAEQTPIAQVSTPGEGAVSAREAAQALANERWKRTQSPSPSETNDAARREMSGNAETPRADALEAQGDTDSGESQDAGTDENPPTGEQTESADTAEVPPIEPPRSWTKEAKERFAALPRDTQEYLAAREDERDRDFNRRQTETAEQRKALEAERGKVEQARTQYETALPALLSTLQEQQAGQFGDIRTMADVNKMAAEDWPRYVLWDAHQKQIAAVQQQVQAATQRQATEKQQKLADFVSSEAKLFAEKVPEATDPAKLSKLQSSAVSILKDIGFAESELGEMWRGEKEISLHDHRLQLLIRDGIRFREINAQKVRATAKPVPPVQRPGVAPPKGAAENANLVNLTKKLESTGNVRDAARLLAAQRAARS